MKKCKYSLPYVQQFPITQHAFVFAIQLRYAYFTGKPTVTSSDLDLTLMVCLLRNLPPVVIAPVNGFDNLPHPNDKTDGANIARLKYHKNFLVSHSKDGTLSKADFKNIWKELEQAIKDLDHSPATTASLKDAETKILDASMTRTVLHQIKLETQLSDMQQQLENISILFEQDTRERKDLKNITDNLEETVELKVENLVMKVVKKNISTLTTNGSKQAENKYAYLNRKEEDHIPKHIRAQHDQEIKEWENDEGTFLKTRATNHILESLPFNNCVVVTGSSGCGKSSIIHHAALHLRNTFGYEVIPVLMGPVDIINFYNKQIKQVFVVDDICGKETINIQVLQTWRDFSEKMEKIFKAVENDSILSEVSGQKLLVSCRLHIYKEPQFQRNIIFTRTEYNLLSSALCLLQRERLLMIKNYLPEDTSRKVMQVNDKVEYFPLLCKLSKYKTLEEVINLFTNPVDSIRKNIINIVSENQSQLCALVLCILFNDGFNTNWLRLQLISEEKKSKLLDITKECGIDLCMEISKNTLKSAFTTLTGTYLQKRGTQYRMIHDKIYKKAAVICGQLLTECFIKYVPSVFFRNNFIFMSIIPLKKSQANGDLIRLSEDKEHVYFHRLLSDLRERVITGIFNNPQLVNQSFVRKLVSFLEMNNEAKLLLKGYDTEVYNSSCYTTPLTESAASGSFDLVHFLIVSVMCNVNNADIRGRSPLYIASESGVKDIVELLIDNNADVLQSDELGNDPLHVACRIGHTDIVALLLQKNAHVSRYNIWRQSPLYVACSGGHVNAVKLLLQNNANINECDGAGKSPLFVACESGDVHTVKMLLQNNADISQCDNENTSPLLIACKRGYTDIVNLLLLNNADVCKYNNMIMSPLQGACSGGYTDIVELLLQNNADVNHYDSDGKSPLYVACSGEHKDIVELLLQNNADVNHYDSDGKSPLNVACRGGHKEIVDLLLQNNADVNHYDSDGKSPLYVACRGGHKDIVDLLLQQIDSVTQCNSTRKSPLSGACYGGNIGIIKLLLQINTDVSQWIDSEVPPLSEACEAGHTNIVKLLLQNKADLFGCDSKGQSPLSVACREGHTNIVKILLSNKADVVHCDNNGRSPLSEACRAGRTHIVKMLLQNKVDVLHCDHDGQSPLALACKKGRTNILKMLLQNKADVLHCDNNGNSPLFLACEEGLTSMVKLLLQNKADVLHCGIYGQSPLSAACEGGHKQIVELLMQNNADVLRCDSNGQSPLFVACMYGYSKIVKILLQYNADVNKCNNSEESPLYMACKEGYTVIVKLLIQHNADVFKCNTDGMSPLYVACTKRRTVIVDMLLQGKANMFPRDKMESFQCVLPVLMDLQK
ncbi:unnamed protein product [Mytilus coruscus]|uniref:Uncharacterized protein n=1 Tax=Mytilus coruscus TaxID=42192 RepID=A0A6J8C7N3_MYTCO|nr:unnamed protein product [Mytilus coruscus]